MSSREEFEEYYAATCKPEKFDYFERDGAEPEKYECMLVQEAWDAWKYRQKRIEIIEGREQYFYQRVKILAQRLAERDKTIEVKNGIISDLGDACREKQEGLDANKELAADLLDAGKTIERLELNLCLISVFIYGCKTSEHYKNDMQKIEAIEGFVDRIAKQEEKK